VRYRFPSGALYNWQFEKRGKEIEVGVNGPVTLDSQELMVEAELQGCGLAYVVENRAARHLASGDLIRCLDDWCAPENALYLYYPSRRYVSAGLRAVIDTLKVGRSIDGADPVLDAERAMAGHVIFAADDRHLVLTGERRHVDEEFFHQDFFDSVVLLQDDAPLPFAIRRLVRHRVEAVSDQFNQVTDPLDAAGAISPQYVARPSSRDHQDDQ
jgi:hypothetical protein